jgi:endonuclease/exonuclease/phosphatase family metal-dependent hydrolase
MQKTLEVIDRFAVETPVSATILAGDFNEELAAPALQAILASKLHFRDAHSVCPQTRSGETFASRNPYVGPDFEPGLRIDFIFATPSLKPAACTVVFDGRDGLDYVSDHFGVLGEFALE